MRIGVCNRRTCTGMAAHLSFNSEDIADIIPPHGGARVFSCQLDPEQFSCHSGLAGAAELGAVNPDAVHDHGQPTRQRPDRLLHAAMLAAAF